MDLLRGCCAVRAGRLREAEELDIRVELVRWHVARAVELAGDPAAFARTSAVLKVT